MKPWHEIVERFTGVCGSYSRVTFLLNKFPRMCLLLFHHTVTCSFLSCDLTTSVVVGMVSTKQLNNFWVYGLPFFLPVRCTSTTSNTLSWLPLNAVSKTLPELFSPKLFHQLFWKTASFNAVPVILLLNWFYTHLNTASKPVSTVFS